ncbi:MAG TPA: cell division protein ZapA [Candidatus Competibacteraceae bacterium]|nr:cell division protein ZapA [Candidatus Competibacteraceae bacterium]MCP5132503.1 cell division protein ZapA [Gammaproteobacteria bacterium]HPF57879.1 cell division protein ZapA [Candidatus Competibacteraceae bacterium]HRF42748.1 cell division protein ZapA [Candidatus Competibacteraceae bacterium]HRY17350.1 cell division protein ZapA [Candidatus Competibacteraceae bacterium]
MSQETHSVVVQLIGYEYRFTCQPSERDELLEAAHYLNEQMGEIRNHGKHLSLEAIAVMTALNLSHDLLRQQRQAADAEAIISRQVRDLLQRVDAVL